MSYTVQLHPKAEKEFIDSYSWYEMQQDGLGEKFSLAIKERLKMILNDLYDTA